jgi:hypothetical protein
MASFGIDLAGLGSTLITKTWHLQRAYDWQLMLLHNFGGAIGYLVSQFCQDITFGDYSIGELSTIKHGAFQRFYAGIQSIDSVTLLFLVPTDNSVMDYFYAWYEHMIDKRGFYSPKDNYKRDVYIMLYDRTKVESVRFRLRGCFPRSHPTVHPSYADEGVLMAQVVLSVDKVEPYSLIGNVRGAVTDFISNSPVGGVASKLRGLL